MRRDSYPVRHFFFGGMMTQKRTGLPDHTRLLQSTARERKGTAKPQWEGLALGGLARVTLVL